MNSAIVLAAGVGQRMRNGGLPKQFLKLMGKPIIIYTLEKFEEIEEIDQVIVVCHGSYTEYMQKLLQVYQIRKVSQIIVGGSDRQSSVQKGLEVLAENSDNRDDIAVIHDGVRPLIDPSVIRENIRVARQYGCAVTVHPVTESVVITESEEAEIADFQKRAATYSMTAPQSFRLGEIMDAYKKAGEEKKAGFPLLDAAMVYAQAGGRVHLVKEQGTNIKITTPEDFYFLKALLELEENKYIFGL